MTAANSTSETAKCWTNTKLDTNTGRNEIKAGRIVALLGSACCGIVLRVTASPDTHYNSGLSDGVVLSVDCTEAVIEPLARVRFSDS
jgi:hypothetical protein